MPEVITASMLYDLDQCPHRVAMDLFGNPRDRDPISAFVQLLWERGQAFEKEVIDTLKLPFADLKTVPTADKERLTREAMARGDGLIYGGRISADDLLGEPDLLRRDGTGYVAGDIKSGAGVEGAPDESDGKPKTHYAVQLALYTDILERIGLATNRRPFVWDVHGQEVTYDLNAPQGARDPTTLWATYQEYLAVARAISGKKVATLPALASACKACHWRTSCTHHLETLGDLTLIPELGRTKRDAMLSRVPNVRDFARADLGPFITGKKTIFPRISPDMLVRLQARARLQVESGPKPYLRAALVLPEARTELFFDVETDPMRDICYLHGFIERRSRDNRSEHYVPFLAAQPTPEEEQRAFSEAWAYVQASRPSVVYYYSPYERTIWRKLQRRYPAVASEAEIEEMFDEARAVDLYHGVVRSKTEWPTRDFSIKTLASHLGFEWRDEEPSGAASIEWYHRWVETGDAGIRQRILEYNEDDCRATRVLLDAVRALPVRSA